MIRKRKKNSIGRSLNKDKIIMIKEVVEAVEEVIVEIVEIEEAVVVEVVAEVEAVITINTTRELTLLKVMISKDQIKIKPKKNNN